MWMSSRTRNEFGIQFSHKRLPNFASKTGLSVKRNSLCNTMKPITMIIKESHYLISGDFSHFERKCAMTNGKQESKIVLTLNFELLVKSMTKSKPTTSKGIQ
jgi:hypothetical protein